MSVDDVFGTESFRGDQFSGRQCFLSWLKADFASGNETKKREDKVLYCWSLGQVLTSWKNMQNKPWHLTRAAQASWH